MRLRVKIISSMHFTFVRGLPKRKVLRERCSIVPLLLKFKLKHTVCRIA